MLKPIPGDQKLLSFKTMKLNVIMSLFLFTNLSGHTTSSNKELTKRIESLEKRMKILENTYSKNQENRFSHSGENVEIQKESQSKISLPKNDEDKKSFLSNLRLQLKSEELKENGPWTNKENWKLLKINFTSFKVRKLLGHPTSIKSSLNPRIQRVYLYRGDHNADGIEEIGTVNFFRDKVISFISPF